MKFATTPQTSVRKMSAQVKTSYSSTYRATKLLKLYLYTVNVVEELEPSYCPKRVENIQNFIKIITKAVVSYAGSFGNCHCAGFPGFVNSFSQIMPVIWV